MKFSCDQCAAKYSIPDEKVRGKILKIRCKACSYVIEVREPEPEPVGPRKPPPVPPAPPGMFPPNNWYYALAGETFGPFRLTVLRGMCLSGEVSPESYVWHETIENWEPIADNSAFLTTFKRRREQQKSCLLYTSPSPRDKRQSRMPSSA